MEIVSGIVITSERVRLDEKHFVDCTFESCELIYSGGPVVFERTGFTGCHYKLLECAGRAFELLKMLGLIQQTLSSEIIVGEQIH